MISIITLLWNLVAVLNHVLAINIPRNITAVYGHASINSIEDTKNIGWSRELKLKRNLSPLDY